MKSDKARLGHRAAGRRRAATARPPRPVAAACSPLERFKEGGGLHAEGGSLNAFAGSPGPAPVRSIGQAPDAVALAPDAAPPVPPGPATPQRIWATGKRSGGSAIRSCAAISWISLAPALSVASITAKIEAATLDRVAAVSLLRR